MDLVYIFCYDGSMELTPQEVLELAKKWQLDPVAKTQDLDKEKETIPVLRDDELAQIQKITKLNVSQTDFNHAIGWIIAEGAVLDSIDKEFQSKQMDPKILEAWAKENELKKQIVEKKKTTWINKHGEVKQNLLDKGVEEKEATESAANFADQQTRDLARGEPVQPTGGEVKINLQKNPVVTSVSVGVGRNRVITLGVYNLQDYLLHPDLFFKKVFTTFKNSLGRTSEKQLGVRDGVNQLSGLGETNVFSRLEKVNVLSGIEQTVTTNPKIAGGLWSKAKGFFGQKATGAVAKKAVAGTVAKTGFKAALTKLGAFIPTGVTQAIAIASTAKDIIDKFIPKELQEKLKDLWSAIQIGMAGVAAWLLMNLGALAGGIIGGIIGGTMGAALVPFFGPLAPVVGSSLGFTVGAFVGYSLQGIASSILGLGGGSAAGGAAVGAGAAPVIPATISIGGFTLPAGLSAAASSFGALLSGSGLSTIALFGVGGGVGLVSLFTALTIITVGATQLPEKQPPTNEGSLFSVEKTADKDTLPNNSNGVITYTVNITGATDIEIIKINDEITQENKTGSKKFTPSVTWPTKLNKDETQTISIPYQISGASYNDSNLVNVVEVTAKSGSKTETLTARATTVIGNPNYTNDRCPTAPTGTPCDPQRMKQFFTGSLEAANNASRICVKESDPSHKTWGNENVINDSCTKNLSPEKMREYSVGLFQINLWAHDNLCKQVLGGQTPFRRPYRAKCTYPDCTPCDRDEDLLKQCKDYWIQPEHNMEYASKLSNNGTHWGGNDKYPTWSTAGPQYCNIP